MVGPFRNFPNTHCVREVPSTEVEVSVWSGVGVCRDGSRNIRVKVARLRGRRRNLKESKGGTQSNIVEQDPEGLGIPLKCQCFVMYLHLEKNFC